MPIAPGVRLGPYAIEAALGAGGMGEVFRARDTRLNRLVAIKFLSEEFRDPSARSRFQQEAQTASALNHPHIVTVHEAGELDGRQYLVTEFVDGGTLHEWARADKRSWRQVVDLMVGVADALAAAHAVGILHRDIKPGNILVTAGGYEAGVLRQRHVMLHRRIHRRLIPERRSRRTQKRAIVVCSAVRRVRAASPSAFTSLKSCASARLFSDGGPAGRKLDAVGITNGIVVASDGARPFANAGGVGRHLPTARLP